MLDILNYKYYKKKSEELETELKELKSSYSALNNRLLQSIEENKRISASLEIKENQLKKYQADFDLKKILQEIEVSKITYDNIIKEIKEKERELHSIKYDIVESINKRDIQIMGMYDKEYDDRYTIEELKIKIEDARFKQKEMLRKNTYYSQETDVYIENNINKGKKLVDKLAKNAIRGFNLNADALEEKITIANYNSIREKVSRIFELCDNDIFCLNSEYLLYRLDEMELCLQISLAKDREKEEKAEQKRILKEQADYEKSLDTQHKQLEKELGKYKLQLEKGDYKVQDRIEELQKAIETNEYDREHLTSGYVYIISNPSLGKDVYKIGLTRRLPNENGDLTRIDELSNASVPFRFTPNCVMFTDNAFELETKLHREFQQYRVNKINTHKEYFKLPLEKIERTIKEKYDKTAVFTYNNIDENFILSGWKLTENFI